MSQQQQNQQISNTPQKPTKTKQQLQKEKDNTNAWQKKQQEKKKKKIQEQQTQNVQLDEKALEKAKRKQQKRLQRQQMLKQQGLSKETEKVEKIVVQVKKEQVKQSSNKDIHVYGKKNAKKVGDSSAKLQQLPSQPIRKVSKDITTIPSTPKPVYTQLLTLQQHLQKSPSTALSINKPQKTQLIHKYLDQYINQTDTILVLSRTDSWHPLASRCGRRVFLYPIHAEYEKCQQCENIVCTYEDVAYLMDGTLTKIFVQLDVVFGNGTAFTQKGNENIIVLANEFKIPVIGFSGTWNFNAWNFLSREMFLNKYGQSHVERYDILENDQFEIIVLEIGSVIPKQVSGHLENLSKIYRGCDINSLKW